jgi:hypothetical protein
LTQTAMSPASSDSSSSLPIGSFDMIHHPIEWTVGKCGEITIPFPAEKPPPWSIVLAGQILVYSDQDGNRFD